MTNIEVKGLKQIEKETDENEEKRTHHYSNKKLSDLIKQVRTAEEKEARAEKINAVHDLTSSIGRILCYRLTELT
jgi:hypothetical protein